MVVALATTRRGLSTWSGDREAGDDGTLLDAATGTA